MFFLAVLPPQAPVLARLELAELPKVASTSLLASVVISLLSSRVTSLLRARASCKPLSTHPPMESSLVTPLPASTPTSAAKTKPSFLAFFLAVHPPLVPARLVLVLALVLVEVYRLAATQVHRDPLAQMQAEMLKLPAPDLLMVAQVATQALQAPDLLAEVQMPTQAPQALVWLASTAMPALILTWPVSLAASSHPQDRQLSTAPLTLLATARSLVKPSWTSSPN